MCNLGRQWFPVLIMLQYFMQFQTVITIPNPHVSRVRQRIIMAKFYFVSSVLSNSQSLKSRVDVCRRCKSRPVSVALWEWLKESESDCVWVMELFREEVAFSHTLMPEDWSGILSDSLAVLCHILSLVFCALAFRY